MTFQSSSRITSIIFDQFRTNIIIGGCYSGQICVWDIRANKRTPVLKVWHMLSKIFEDKTQGMFNLTN